MEDEPMKIQFLMTAILSSVPFIALADNLVPKRNIVEPNLHYQGQDKKMMRPGVSERDAAAKSTQENARIKQQQKEAGDKNTAKRDAAGNQLLLGVQSTGRVAAGSTGNSFRSQGNPKTK
jgi:hypothetical protein